MPPTKPARKLLSKPNSTRAKRVSAADGGSIPAGRKRPLRAAAAVTGATSAAKFASKPEVGRTIGFVPPQLATLVDRPPEGDEWFHELKFDGFRVLCRKQGNVVTLFTRSGQDWTDRFGDVARAAAKLKTDSALLDGEVAVLRADGTTDFQALQNYLQGTSKGALTYFAFDLLFQDGEDLRPRPLEERKERLAGVIPTRDAVIRYSDHMVGHGATFFEKARQAGLEGIVSKRRDQPYRGGRGPGWVKTKALQRQETVIGGFTEPEGARSGIGALLVGFWKGDSLAYAGKVGTGFDSKSATSLRRRLDALIVSRSPFAERVPPEGRVVRWVEPKLVAEVAYSEITSDGKLRHPSFQGLREDKPARDVVQEKAQHVKTAPAASPASETDAARTVYPSPASQPKRPATHSQIPSPRPRTRPTPPGLVQIEGITLSHPERLLEEKTHTTKQDLAEYLALVAPYMLPHLIDRPLSLVRCPEGLASKCFFMKHAAFATPQLRRITIREKEDKGEYLVADTASALVALAQMSVLEIHTWNSVGKTLEQPDRVVFDFDPGPDAPWQTVVDGALLVKRRVEQIGCATFLKSTGGKGLHVVVPLIANADWDECRTFTQLVSESVANEDPKRFTTAIRKAGREDKVLIDYFRNTRSATSVSIYSTRARPGVTVSWPIAWDDLLTFSPERPFTIASATALLRKGYRDPWKDYPHRRVDLKKVISAAGKPPNRRARRPTS